MGAWGYYDDENDEVLDYITEVENELRSRQGSKQTKIKQLVDKLERDFKEGRITDHIVAGVALYIARECVHTDFPGRLPDNFPRKLQVLAYNATEAQIDTDNDDWVNVAERRRALDRQLKLFELP